MDADACGQVLGKIDGSPPAVRTERSMAPHSSRTLPGQPYNCNAVAVPVARAGVRRVRRSAPTGSRRRAAFLAFTHLKEFVSTVCSSLMVAQPGGTFLLVLRAAAFRKYAQTDLTRRKGKFPPLRRASRPCSGIRPFSRLIAPVKAPRTCPNNRLSARFSEGPHSPRR